ncbi:hypothetical protein AMS68_000122 [Peltaster fructicola]|uniref:AAA+ ATPase domain-containing protein n=1 Tax=Peltaster fructicola TaxID=286661 RepID=A0A6H0XJ04_9PEZI|nr:hypothetical protein AMS68_000122 [Peltaster fructicola]
MAVQTVVMSGNVTTAVHPFFSRPKEHSHADNGVSHDNTSLLQHAPIIGKSDVEREERHKLPVENHLSFGEVLNEQHKDVGKPTRVTSDRTVDEGSPRKKRKTSHTGSLETSNGLHEEHAAASPRRGPGTGQRDDFHQADGAVDGSCADTTGSASINTQSVKPKTPPKKMLRLNASGRFSSPITNSTKAEEATSEQPKRRGRPRKSKEAPAPKQLVVRIHYATTQGSSTGDKIAQILASNLTIPLPQKQSVLKNPRTPRKPAKATHPFFADKPKATKLPKQISPRKTAAVTPGKLRMQAQFERGAPMDDIFPIAESALLKDRLMVKHPGAKEPLWPAKGMAHVRGDVSSTTFVPKLRLRKQKHRLPAANSSLLTEFARRLVPEPEPTIRADGFREPRADLRIPDKLLISGAEIASLALKEVKAPLAHGPPDELALESVQPTHAAVEHVYRNIPSYLSAFDHLQSEHQSWTQKYAPERSELVLQSHREMQVLKSWLQSLAVNAVDVAKTDPATKSAGVKRKKKRKTRHSELDDFIVDEGDDIRSLGTISDTENSSQSMVQSQVAGVRASNTVLISGPHGCGKTAAVYAVAKELQYRVFEISSSERRSGKDVFDKIGNVTENHIVKKHNADQPELPATEEKDRVDAALRQDLESGRQGKMAAFFKPKAAQLPKSSPTEVVKAKVVKNVQHAIKRAKDQQQSLILLEEVDILFKEDKEFWTTIFKLIQTSKRPFIMTRNDEDLVPVQALSLHAVLRFVPAEADTVIDYLLLVAAREGHLVERRAISSLWQDSGHDLRRSLTTLDFWCRMGVGDIRNGLGWMFQRWPLGSDLDAKGRPLRVVSKGTYLAGLGSRHRIETQAERTLPYHDDQLSLKDASIAAFTSSSVDILSKHDYIDPTLPELPPKQRAHYIEGLALLDGQEPSDYAHLQSDIQVTAASLAHDLYPHWHEPKEATRKLNRKNFASLDALAYPASSNSVGMESSVLDGPFLPVVTEVAPYVRQVVRYEQLLQTQRTAIGGPTKRARTTRAARSALEGGQRQLTRREYWWDAAGDLSGVLATAGTDWCLNEGRECTPFSLDGSVEAAE